MIKVNLLKDQTLRVASKSFTATSGGHVHWFVFGAVVVVLAFAIAYVTNQFKTQIAKNEEKISELQQEEKRLEQLHLKMQEYESLTQQRQNRIDVIEKLKASQKGPVRLLNAVINSIPSDGDVWLRMLEKNDASVKILGQTRLQGKIPDLLDNFLASGSFSGVELEKIRRTEKNDISEFSIIGAGIQRAKAE